MHSLPFFLRFFVWFSLRHMRRNIRRTLVVMLGVALGAAVFTSVRLSVHASLDSFSRSMDMIAGNADYTVLHPGGSVPEPVVATLLRQRAVRSASPVVSAYVIPPGDDAAPFLLMGFDPILDRPVRDWSSAETAEREDAPWLDLIKEPFSLIAGAALADELGLTSGSVIPLQYPGRKAGFRVLGRLANEGLALVEGGRVALTDIATFQEFTGQFGQVDRIDLVLHPSATEVDMAGLRQSVPEELLLVSPSREKRSGRQMIRAYQLNLSVLSFASLFVGMFLVYSLVALNTASRRRELAILRSLGASSRMILFLFLAEGLLFGIAGWLLAIPVSSFLVKYLLHGVSQTITTLFVRVQVDRLVLSGWEFALSFGVTALVSVLAAGYPAREAMDVDPAEALAQAPGEKRHRTGPVALAGIAVILLVWPLSLIPGPSGFPWPGYLATFLLFLGFALLSPWLLARLGSALSPLLRRFFGETAWLAGRYVRDSGMRTAISVGALITAVALFAALVIMVHSFRQSVQLWTEQTVSGDLFVRPRLSTLNRYRDPLPDAAVQVLNRHRSTADLAPYRRIFLYYGDHPYEFEAIEMKPFFDYGGFNWVAGDPATARKALIRGEGVVVSEVFSARTGLDVGDRFRAPVLSSRMDLPVLGVVRDYRTHGGMVFYPLDRFQDRTGDPHWSGTRVYLGPSDPDPGRTLSEIRRDLATCCRGLDITTGKDLRQAILNIFDETFAVTTVLLLIALLVAALGIATTLTVLVLERSRQLNTLLAVGGSRGQIRTMIVWEGLLMVLAGEASGLVCGFILSWILVYVINYQSFGWTFLYGVDWPLLSMSLPLILFTALISALPAMRQAFRKSPATLLREK